MYAAPLDGRLRHNAVTCRPMSILSHEIRTRESNASVTSKEYPAVPVSLAHGKTQGQLHLSDTHHCSNPPLAMTKIRLRLRAELAWAKNVAPDSPWDNDAPGSRQEQIGIQRIATEEYVWVVAVVGVIGARARCFVAWKRMVGVL